MTYRILPVLFLVTVSCATATKGDEGAGGDAATDDPCIDGATRCQENAYLVCEGGHFVVQEECPQACAGSLGCVACVPGTTTCSGEDAGLCRTDGSGYDPFVCDPLQGLGCNIDSHECEGACAPQNIGQSYVGCEYFPTVTGNEVRNEFEFAVVVSNDRSEPVNIHIEGGALGGSSLTFDLAPRSVLVQKLPWVADLKACEAYGVLECGNPQRGSARAIGGAYHLRSTGPVSVYQYNPLDYGLESLGCSSETLDGCSFTNDASLLLPATAMTGRYYVSSWPNWYSRTGADFPGFVSITATRDNTQVTVTATANSSGAFDLPGLSPGVPATITLNAGDVAQYFATRYGQESADLTGTLVQADKPVQVIGGHYCTETIGMACDHMEESMLPVEALSTRYIVTAPEATWQRDFWGEEFTVGERYLRIVATEPDTTITYDPPSFRLAPGQSAPTYLANAGDVGEIVYAYFRDSVEIKSNKKILVTEYMMGGQQANIGDPSMAVAVPVEQYRKQYSFHAPTNYDLNYVNVVAPATALVFLDGASTALSDFEPIGGTGYGLLRVPLDNAGSGTHSLQSTEPFGITVYGYGQYTSYWYAGGLDLTPIVVE